MTTSKPSLSIHGDRKTLAPPNDTLAWHFEFMYIYCKRIDWSLVAHSHRSQSIYRWGLHYHCGDRIFELFMLCQSIKKCILFRVVIHLRDRSKTLSETFEHPKRYLNSLKLKKTLIDQSWQRLYVFVYQHIVQIEIVSIYAIRPIIM